MTRAAADESLVVARLTAFGLDAADSVATSAGGFGLAARSFAQVREPGRPIDQAEPSEGSRGEGWKTEASEVASLASREVRPPGRPGVLTLEVEAVLTASPSMVDGGRPFQTLEGLPVLVVEAEASGQVV